LVTFEVGDYKLTTLEFGRFKLDGGAMFGVVPRVLWARFHPPDENNQIDMALRCLLIEGGGKRILVDAGFGPHRTERFRQMYAFTGSDDYLDRGLEAVSRRREDITDVFLTHLHFDHCGGASMLVDGKRRPSFPNAQYHYQRDQLEHARKRFERDKASYFADDFEPPLNTGQGIIHDGPFNLTPDIDALICNGHTPGMQLPRIRGGGRTVVYAADLIPLSSQFPLPWIMSYDLYPVQTLEEKRIILTEAAREEWLFIFEHDPIVTSGQVVMSERGFALKK